jgi:CysZ protein
MTNTINRNNPFLALQCLLAGVKLLARQELRKYLLIPLLVNFVLYSAAFAVSYHAMSGLIQHMIPAWLSWLDWILWPVFFLSFLVISFFSFTLMVNLFAAPYYNRLAAKTLEIISGRRTETAEPAWNKVFFAELKRIGYILIRVLPLLILFLIPVVNMIAPLLWTLFAAWGIALEYMAYPLENRGLLFAEQKQFLQQARWGVLTFGGVTGLCLSLPVVNLLIGPAAVIGATIYVYKLKAV